MLLMATAACNPEPQPVRQESARQEPARQYKMTTPVPPGIAAPDKIESRLGTLKLFDGFPDDATVEKLYDNLDFQRAVQAYLLALAPVNMVGLREGLLKVGPANITIPTFENTMDSRSLFLTANATVAYTWVWIDLHGGPLVAEVPPMTLGMIDDFWFQYVTDIGVVGPDKGKGGKYLLLPPGYKGEVPAGYLVVRVPTFESILVWRNMPVNGDIKPSIESLKKFTRIYPLSQASNPPANTFVNVSGREFSTVAVADYRFWECLNDVVQKEPVESLDPVTLGFYASIGIEKGKPFAPDARMKEILTEAAAVGDATVRAITFRSRIPEAFYYPNSTWRQWLGGYKFQSQPGVRLPGCRRLLLFLCDRRDAGHGSEDGRPGVAVCGRAGGLGRRPAGRRQELPAAPAAQHPGEGLLVGDRLRQPDPFHAADRPAVPPGQQSGQGRGGQR